MNPALAIVVRFVPVGVGTSTANGSCDDPPHPRPLPAAPMEIEMNREPTRAELEDAETWYGDRVLFTKEDVILCLARYANHVGAQIYKQAASMLPDAVHGVRGSTVVDLRYLQGHLHARAKRLTNEGAP